MNNLEAVVTIVVAIAGCGGFWEWWRVRQERRQQSVTRTQRGSDIRSQPVAQTP